MRLLLDTNVLIRMLEEPDRLSDHARNILDDADNALFVTTVSLAEIAIKVGTGKLAMPSRLVARLNGLGCEWLRLEIEHAMRLATLPVIHRDPFDRLIVAQALAEDLTLVTSDRTLADYGGSVLRA